VGWRVHGEVIRLRVVTPAGTSAQVDLPDGRTTEVYSGTSLFEFPAPTAPHV
jgi:hypothetical protein